MDLKRAFVLAALAPGANISELCREHGISRNNGYKWIRRYEKEGDPGLEQRSRRPRKLSSTDGETVLRIIELRRLYSKWGAKKFHKLLLDQGHVPPNVKTIARILDRAGEPRVRRPRRRLNVILRQHEPLVVNAPNDVWTVDFKGWWRTRDGKRYEPLTVRDAFSRYVLCLEMLGSTRAAVVQPAFHALFEKHGLPSVIRVDNGSPFACTAAPGGLSRLSAWWTSLGIRVSFSRPAHPQDNGGHERMHADVAAELEFAPADSLGQQQLAADKWRQEFNQVRPHEALAMKTPAALYANSSRPFRGISAPRYSSGYALRRISRNGCVRYLGRIVFISQSLIGHDVAVRKASKEHIAVRFYDLPLGLFDLDSAPRHHADRLIPLHRLPSLNRVTSP